MRQSGDLDHFHMTMNFFYVFTDLVDIFDVSYVNLVDALNEKLFTSILKHLLLLYHGDLRKSFLGVSVGRTDSNQWVTLTTC